MNDQTPNRRWPRFGLRGLFVAVTLVGILTALLMRMSQHASARLEYVNHAGAINGHVRTMQAYRFRVNRWRLAWWLFRQTDVEEISLYPGTYGTKDLEYIRGLFPEAKIDEKGTGIFFGNEK